MGITIAYKGKLNNPGLIYPFCNELSDIAKDMNWEYQILDEDFDRPNTAYLDRESPVIHIKGHLALKGISIHIHPDSGSLSFYFDKHGNIRNIVSMVTEGGNVNPENIYEFIKTQFAPPEVHMTVVKLLRHIKKKYISDLFVNDEASYWETNDETILKEKMDFLRQKINGVKKVIMNSEIMIKADESPISIADKIEKLLIEKSDIIYKDDGIEEFEESD